MTLLIDNSNSRTKFVAWPEDREPPAAAVDFLPTRAVAAGEIPAAWRAWHGPVLLASVVPAAAARIAAAFDRPETPLHGLGPASPLGVGIDYPQPEQIGADRLANAAALAADFPDGAVALDFGTALTFDVVVPVPVRGLCYRGGVIVAGLDALTEYLHERTALLPRVEIGNAAPPALGRSTEAAIRAGAWHGYRGLVRGILASLREELGLPDLPAIATGGYARRIAGDLPEVARVDPLLTLRGLAEVARRLR